MPSDSINFEDGVFEAELEAIAERHNRTSRPKITDIKAKPSTQLGLTGLTCSGGGIRSASFCLGVLQGLQSQNVIRNIDYLSTVSGGGYIGTTMSIGMSCSTPDSSGEGLFPFSRLNEGRETPEVRHLRDNSRYLVQNGIRSVISALVIYLRGIAMNVLVVVPLLLLAAALLLSLNPNTKELVTNEFLWWNLTGWFGGSRLPFTLAMVLFVAAVLVGYAILVSVRKIAPLKKRRTLAAVMGWVFFAAFIVVLLELHTVLLRLVFESRAVNLIQYPPGEHPAPQTAQVFTATVDWIKTVILAIAPIVVAILPFIKKLAAKAVEGDGDGWGEFFKRIASRIVLLIVAGAIPVLLWLGMMQFAFWGTAVSECADGTLMPTACTSHDMYNNWDHAPGWVQWLFEFPGQFRLWNWLFPDPAMFHWMEVATIYGLIAGLLLLSWLFLSVNANSLHQLYRDRLGSAFLVQRKNPNKDDLEPADEFDITKLKPTQAPYHLINTALNVPGSPFANKRGRNADFFMFSPCFIGSEATGYVGTSVAEKAVDGLNIGTAMAISGAAAAPNMGMASVRPLSPTIALLNVRLGRWIRHPSEIAHRISRWEDRRSKARARTSREGQYNLFRIPGPTYLLREAFAKSGETVTQRNVAPEKTAKGQLKALWRWAKRRSFVFLTDGGHVDNLGIYELLRRRCRLIIAIDAEADPDLDGASLVQIERFARIDMNVQIRMNWKPIKTRTCMIDDEIKKNALQLKNGPHVAVGLISYPPSSPTGQPEQGVLVYIKASMSGDENDYVMSYKARYSAFPHESTMDQLFSEEQFEAYRALGDHIARRFVDGTDPAAAFAADKPILGPILKEVLPEAKLA